MCEVKDGTHGLGLSAKDRCHLTKIRFRAGPCPSSFYDTGNLKDEQLHRRLFLAKLCRNRFLDLSDDAPFDFSKDINFRILGLRNRFSTQLERPAHCHKSRQNSPKRSRGNQFLSFNEGVCRSIREVDSHTPAWHYTVSSVKCLTLTTLERRRRDEVHRIIGFSKKE